VAGSQTAYNAEQVIARLVAEHAAGCAKLACTAKDGSLDIALDLIILPLAVVIVALLLQRAGFWDGLLRILTTRLRRAWLAQAGFGAVLAVMFVAVSLPFGLYDVMTADPATQSGFRCVDGPIKCPFPELTRADMVANFLEKQLWYALRLAVIFAVLAPLAFALQSKRPGVLLVIASVAYLAWLLVPMNGQWKQTYPVPQGPLREDVAHIAGRAGITMDRVLMGQPEMLGGDGGGGKVEWIGGETKAIIGERLLNIHVLHPRVFNPPQGPYSAAEFRFVAAHEIAHVRHSHFEWVVAASLLLTALFAATAFILANQIHRRDLRSTGAGFLAMFLAFGFAANFVLMPIRQNLWRVLENQADATALDLARDPDGAITFILTNQRNVPLVLNRWYHLLYRTHPDNMTRLRRAVEWKAGNKADAWRAQGLSGPVRERWRDELQPVTDWPETPAAAEPDA
jgi:hypothetical protein